jgi:hypothetical protein
MPNAFKRAAMAASLLIPLSVAQAAPMQLQSLSAPMIIDVQPESRIEVPGNFHPIEIKPETGGGFQPMLIDGARDEARVDFSGPIHGEAEQDDERPGLQTRQFELQVSLSCEVSGDDLIIANIGMDAVAAGSTIKWQVKGSGQKGYLAMKSDVQPGKGFKARGVVDGAQGERCSARGV